MTERLYYSDSHIRAFSAAVTACTPREDAWEVLLDKTAFFPGGGGQEPDSGTIGGVAASGWGERDGLALHRCAAPVEVGSAVECAIDWDTRFERMQLHSGEHILSGVLHRLYGASNVGFHMGADAVTVDFDVPLTQEQLADAQSRVNRAIWENVPVTQSFPPPEALDSLSYRSKLELRENVRLVTVEGYDCCACCAPHVLRTGEIGLFLILDAIRRRDGTRVQMLAGKPALELLCRRSGEARRVSALLSVPPEEIGSGMERYAAAHEALREECASLRRKQLDAMLASLSPCEGNLVLIEDGLTSQDLRTAVNAGVEKCTGLCGAFTPSDGGYRYVIGTRDTDLKPCTHAINAALSGRGGGRGSRIEGSCAAEEAVIRQFFDRFSL